MKSSAFSVTLHIFQNYVVRYTYDTHIQLFKLSCVCVCGKVKHARGEKKEKRWVRNWCPSKVQKWRSKKRKKKLTLLYIVRYPHTILMIKKKTHTLTLTVMNFSNFTRAALELIRDLSSAHTHTSHNFFFFFIDLMHKNTSPSPATHFSCLCFLKVYFVFTHTTHPRTSQGKLTTRNIVCWDHNKEWGQGARGSRGASRNMLRNKSRICDRHTHTPLLDRDARWVNKNDNTQQV